MVVDFKLRSQPLILIGWVRIGFLSLLMSAVIISQFIHPFFFNPEYEVPVLILLAASFLFNVIFILNMDALGENRLLTLPFFYIDVLLITLLLIFAQSNLPIFILMYIINVLLCGLIFGQRHAITIAGVTAISFNLGLVLGPSIEGQPLLFSLIFNNLSFFTVAWLSGYLADQLNVVGEELDSTSKDLEALRRINEIIVDHMPAGLITTDAKDYVIRSNPAAESILGLDPIGKTISEIFPSSESIEAARNGRQDIEYELAGSEMAILSVTGKQYYDAGEQVGSENVSGHIFVFEDQTQVRRIEQKMRQTEKLAAVGQLAAGIAHEIRNPLASISGSVELLGVSLGSLDNENKRLMSIVVKETHRLSDLITEFLEYVRPDKPVKDEVNVSNLVHEVVEIVKLNPNLPQNVELQSVVANNVYTLGDRNKLKQAILNIVINGFQAMADKKEGAVCSVEVSEDAKLTIKDNGVGMDEKTRLRIFEPFLTTKAKGTGLGLAVTHKILENMRADILVNSTLGEGTEFSIQFIPAPKKNK